MRWRLYLALVAIAAVVQVAFILESSGSRVFQVPIVDAAAYHAQALALASGQPSSQRAFWQPPLYPYALGGLYRLGVTNLLSVRLIHGLLGVAAAFLACAIGCRFGGRWTGLASGVAVSFYGPLLFYFSQLLPTGIAVVLNLCGLWLLLRLSDRPTGRRAFAVGLAAGVATLAVVNSAVLVIVALGWMAWRGGSVRGWGPPKNPARGTAVLAVALIAGFVFGVAPVTLRNYAVSGEFVPVSTNGGVNLYVGNNPHLEQTLTVRPGLDWGRLVALPYRQGAKTDAEAEGYFLRETGDFAVHHPAVFVWGLFQKAWQALGSREIPRNEDLYAFAGQSLVLRALVWRIGSFCFPFGLVGPLAVVGAFVVTRRRSAAQLDGRFVLAFAVAYIASVVLFFPTSRYLAPAMPALLILAVLGVRHLIEWPSLSASDRGLAAGLLAVSGVLSNLPRQLPSDGVNYGAELHTQVGVGLQTRGRVEEAVEEYREAIRLDPGCADAHRYLGSAYRIQGKPIPAAMEFECALKFRPDHEGAMADLAVVRYEQGRVVEAVEWLRTVLDLNPDDRQAMINLAVGLRRLNRRVEAAEWFKKAGVSNPDALVVPVRPGSGRDRAKP